MTGRNAMGWKSIVAAVLAVLMIVAATAWVTAQAVAITKVPPKVMTGTDVGFRVEGLRGTTPVGTIVLKVNGEWVAAEDNRAYRRSPA
jgi:hypothetical protein